MGFKKQNSRKKAENGDFQVVGSLLYAHYPIYFFLLFEKYYQVLLVFPLATFTMAPRHALFLQRHAPFPSAMPLF